MNKKWLTWIISLVILAALAWFFRDQLDFITEGLRRLRHAEPFPAVSYTHLTLPTSDLV